MKYGKSNRINSRKRKVIQSVYHHMISVECSRWFVFGPVCQTLF